MVLTCIAKSYKQVGRIKRSLIGAQVFEEKIGEIETVISVRVQTAAEIERVKAVFKGAGAADIFEVEEAA